MCTSLLPAVAAAALVLPAPAGGGQTSIPSMVVTVENVQPSRGVFLTPVWIGIHDGTFDPFDVGSPASVEIERLAEDGDNGPIGTAFEAAAAGTSGGAVLMGPSGPLAPGDRAAKTLNIDPFLDRYFGFASMVIPSNDTFVGNDDPLAHPLFGVEGGFIGRSFVVSAADTRDAGTEVNDELAENVAFLAQAMPNTGTTEGGPVTSPSPGFADAGTLTYPDGVLNHPVFGMADFAETGSPLLLFRFRFVDLGGRVAFGASLNPEQEIQPTPVESEGRGRARILSANAESVTVRVLFAGLTGPVDAAHLHLAPAGVNGPVVLPLTAGIGEGFIDFTGTAADLDGPLAGEDLLALLNEMAAGNVYVNLHTTEFPAGEIRGQVQLQDDLVFDVD